MRGKFDEYKKSLTAVAVARMSGKQMRRILGAIKFQGRSKLKVGDGSMKTKKTRKVDRAAFNRICAT